MKKLIPAILLCLPLAAVAEPLREIHNQKDFCQGLAQMNGFNSYLEEACGFNEGTYIKTVQVYRQRCGNIFSRNQLIEYINQVWDDSDMRIARVGKETFCSANRQGYLNAGRAMDEMMRRQSR